MNPKVSTALLWGGLALMLLGLGGCGSNVDAWRKAHDKMYSDALRRMCDHDYESRQRMRSTFNVMAVHSFAEAERSYQSYRRSYGYTQSELHFCEGRDFVGQSPEANCLVFEHMRPSEVGGGLAYLLGQFDYCKEIGAIE